MYQYWEGWDGNFKRNDNNAYLAGSFVNSIEQKRGIHISKFDSLFNIKLQNIVFYDSIDKRAFYTNLFHDRYYYITGSIYFEDIEQLKLLLVKADSLGNYLWHKNYSGEYAYGSKIIETIEHNVLVGGARSYPIGQDNTKWYLLKTDTAGNVIWEQEYGRNHYDNGKVNGLIETQDSNYLACGAYPAARYGGGGGEYLWDGCLRKIDTDGNLIWERLYRNYSKYSTGGDESIRMKESFAGIYKDYDNYIYIISNTYGNNPFFRGSLIKLNSKGDIVFKRLYYAIDQYSNEQWFSSFRPTNDGGFILAGYGNAYDWYGYNPPQQAWLVKTDSLGIDGLCYTAPPELNIDIVLPATLNCSDTITVYAYIAGKSAP